MFKVDITQGFANVCLFSFDFKNPSKTTTAAVIRYKHNKGKRQQQQQQKAN